MQQQLGCSQGITTKDRKELPLTLEKGVAHAPKGRVHYQHVPEGCFSSFSGAEILEIAFLFWLQTERHPKSREEVSLLVVASCSPSSIFSDDGSGFHGDCKRAGVFY